MTATESTATHIWRNTDVSAEIKFLPSRDGSVFGTEVAIEQDGSLRLTSNYGKGYRSAHRDYAQKHFGEALWNMHRVVFTSDARMVMTRWNTQAFRKA